MAKKSPIRYGNMTFPYFNLFPYFLDIRLNDKYQEARIDFS